MDDVFRVEVAESGQYLFSKMPVRKEFLSFRGNWAVIREDFLQNVCFTNLQAVQMLSKNQCTIPYQIQGQALKAVGTYEFIQIDGKQLESKAQVATKLKVVIHFDDIVLPIGVLHRNPQVYDSALQAGIQLLLDWSVPHERTFFV